MSREQSDDRIYGCLFIGLALIMLGVVGNLPVPDLGIRVLLGLAIGFATAGFVILVKHALWPNTLWRDKLIDGSIFLASFLVGALLVLASTSDPIILSRTDLACGSGLEAAPVDNGEKFLLTWRDANVNTYCQAKGIYPANGAQRLVVRVSNLNLQEANPSFKVDTEGVHLPLVDPADGNPELVDAPWARLKPKDIGFVLPENVVHDELVSNFILTFYNVRQGSLQVALFLQPSRLGRMLAAIWPVLLGIALTGGIVLIVAWVRKRPSRFPPIC